MLCLLTYSHAISYHITILSLLLRQASLRLCMKDIYRVFGLEWPPLQSETPQGATADPESSLTLTTGDKPSSPKQDQSQSKSEIIKEKSSLDKPGSEAMADEPKV